MSWVSVQDWVTADGVTIGQQELYDLALAMTIPAAPAPVIAIVVSDPYADCERMTNDDGVLLVNRRFNRPNRKVDANSNPLPVLPVPSKFLYEFGRRRGDADISHSWKNVDAGIKAQDATKKGKRK